MHFGGALHANSLFPPPFGKSSYAPEQADNASQTGAAKVLDNSQQYTE